MNKIFKWIKKYWEIILSSILMLCLIGMYINYNNLLKDNELYKNAFNVSNDSVIYYTNKLGEEVAKVQNFEAQNTKDFLKLNFQDSTIKELQKEIEKYKKKNLQYSAIIKSYAEIDTTAKVIYVPTEEPTQPIYKWKVANKWYDIEGISKYDNTELKAKFYNDFAINSYIEKGKIYTEVTDKNPYSNITTVRSFSLPNKYRQKRIGIGPSIGYGIPDGFYFGISLNYNAILIW